MSIDKILKTIIVSQVPTDPFGANADASSATGSISAKLRAIATALEIIDDWDETDRAKVNLVVGQAGITAGAGSVAANTPRVTHASDDPVTTALQIMDDWDNGASDGASVSGDVAHDAADAGEPVKIGGKAETTEPAVVADADRVNAWFDEYGSMSANKRHVVNASETPTNIVTAYNTTNETQTSDAITRKRGCLYADVVLELSRNGVPTNIEIFIEGIDSSEAHHVVNGFQGKWIFTGASIGASGIHRMYRILLPATPTFQVRVTTSGTDNAGNDITIDRFNLYQISL